MDPLRATHRRAPLIEALEPRLLFSGDAAGAAVGEAIAWAAPAAAPEASVVWTALTEVDGARQAVAPRELAVVDARVPDVGRLLADFDAQRAAGRPIDVVVLGAGEDALRVLDDELVAADVPYRAVHFFGHGTSGSMQMGATSLDLATVRTNADAIARWSAGLTVDADLLLWGCDTGAGAAGLALLDALAGLTGADVAASDDASGSLAHGADWTLEVVHGAIETQAPIGAPLQAAFDGVLAAEAPATSAAVVVPLESGGRQLAGNATGSVAVWVDATTDTVVAQRYDAAGDKRGGLITVASGAGRAAAVAIDADGGDFIIVWQDGNGSSGKILAQRFLADGIADGGPLAVTADATANPMRPAVAMNARGDAVVVWAQDVITSGTITRDIVYRRISALGVLGTSGGLLADADRVGDQTLPSVAMQGDGGFAVAFLDSAAGGSIKVVAVHDAADPVGGLAPVEVSAIGQTAVAAPSIAAMAGDRYVIAWSASAASPADAVVRAVVLGSETGVPGVAFLVSDAAPGVAADRPSVAVAPDGTLVVVWQQNNGGDVDLRGRVLTAVGSAYGASFMVNRDTTGTQQAASAAIVNGALQVVWTGPSTDTVPVEQTLLRRMSVLVQDDSGGRQLAANGLAGFGSVAVWVESGTHTVVAQRYDDAGVANGALITVSDGAGRIPAVAMDADGGGFIVVWQHDTDESGQILARRYLADGNPDGGLIAVTSNAAENPSRPAVAMNADGDAVVVWAQEMGAGPNRSVGLVYSRIEAGGTVASAAVTLTHSAERRRVQTNPSVAMQAGGGFAVAFLDASDGGSIQVIAVPNSADPPSGIESVPVSQVGQVAGTAPSIAAIADGRYVVAWSSAAPGAVATVQATIVNGQTGEPDTAFQVSDAAAGVAAARPSIAVTPGNSLIVVWQEDNAGEVDLRGRLLDLAGAPFQPSFEINPPTAGAQHHASVAVTDGALQILWSGPSADPTSVAQTSLRAITGTVKVNWPTYAFTDEADGNTGGQTLQVALTLPPAGTVTLRVTVINSRAGADEATVYDGELTFDATNWSRPRTVTVRGNNELRALDDGDQSYTVRVAVDASATIASWQRIAAQERTFVNLDDDVYSEFVVTTNEDIDDVDLGARASGDPLTPFDLWLHAQAGSTVSLREALLAANHQDEAGSERDRIRFVLPEGQERITLGSALPSIVHAVDIDGGGRTSPRSPLRVTLTRSDNVGGGVDGLRLDPGSDGSRIAHLSIGGFGGNAVLVRSSGNTIEGNHLGVDASGTGALRNGQRGLSLHDDLIADAVGDNTIRDNVIGANDQGGIRILGANASGNVVQGNFIGTDRSLRVDLGNGDTPGVDQFGYGILLTNGAHDNLIGGPDNGQANVLRFNGDRGIVVVAASSIDNALLRNVIDTDGSAIVRGAGTRAVATPVLSSARPGGTSGVTLVDVVLTGTAGTYYRLDFYIDRSPFTPGSTVPVDAQTWIDGVSDRVVRIGSSGSWSGTVTLRTVADYKMAVTATATETDNDMTAPRFGETSALSNASRVNQLPEFQSTSNLSVAESTVPGASGAYQVGPLQAVDPDDELAPLSWSIAGGADRVRFSIDAATGVLSFTAPPDFEEPTDADSNNRYQVRIRIVDVMGGQRELRYVVTVTNVNERATLSLPSAAVSVTEDTPLLLSSVATLSVSDPDTVSEFRRNIIEVSVERGLLTLGSLPEEVELRSGLAAGSSRFVIAGSTDDLRRSLATLGYLPVADDNGDVTLTITVRDRATSMLSSTGTVTLRIAAVNDAPVLVTAPPGTPIDLRATASVAIDGTLLKTTDVDHTASQVVYTLQSGAAAGQLLRDGTVIAPGGTFTQADVDAGRMSFLAPTQGGFQQLTLAVSDAANASAAQAPVTLKLSIQSLAAPATSPAADSTSDASSSTASTSGTAASGGSAASVGAGEAAAGGAGAASARAGAAASGAGSGTQSAVARSGAHAAAASGATASTGAIATQAGGADASAARQELSGMSREPSGGPMAGGVGAAAVSTSLLHSNDMTERVRSATAGVTAGALADAWRRADALQAAERAVEVQQAWSPAVALRQTDFREELAQSREDVASKFQARSALVASSVAISTSLSLGYAIWLLRGGVLLTSLLASMPAWRSIDPLPVLARIDARGQDDGDEDDSLRGLLQRAADEQAEQIERAEQAQRADWVAEVKVMADRQAVPAGRLAEGMA